MEKTRFGITEFRGASKQTENGYRMEFLIPWSEIQGADPKAGVRWGFNAIFASRAPMEIVMSTGLGLPGKEFADHPDRWGTVELVR